MLKYCVDQWDKNKGKLKERIRKLTKENKYSIDYKDLMKEIVDVVLSDDGNYSRYSSKNVGMITIGSYQGDLLFVLTDDHGIAHRTLISRIGYGSCSGCDALEAAVMNYGYDDEVMINDLMKICQDLVMNIVKPFNRGFEHDEKFDHMDEVK